MKDESLSSDSESIRSPGSAPGSAAGSDPGMKPAMGTSISDATANMVLNSQIELIATTASATMMSSPNPQSDNRALGRDLFLEFPDVITSLFGLPQPKTHYNMGVSGCNGTG
jgi:hypothetical protein